MNDKYENRNFSCFLIIDKPYHPHTNQDHRRHYSSNDINYNLQHPRPHSQNSYYSRSSQQQHPIKDFSNNQSVQSPLALHSTNNIQTASSTKHNSLNKSNSVSASSAYSSKMNSNKHMANDQKHMPSNSTATTRTMAGKNVNSTNSKRKIISPEEVIQLFSVPQNQQQQHQHGHQQHPHLTGFLGHHHQQPQSQQQLLHQQYLQGASRQRTSSGSAIINDHHRGRKSPSSASSPPTMTHQV